MARTQHVRYGFNAGVLSPRLAMRGDLSTYGYSLKECKNFYVTPHGGIIYREGMKHIRQTVANRIFTFRRGGDETDLLVEVTDGQVDLYDDPEGSPIATFTNFIAPVDDQLYFDNTERYAVICHPTVPPYVIEQDAFGNYVGDQLPHSSVPLVVYTDAKSPQTAAIKSTYVITIPNTWAAGQRYTVTYGGLIGDRDDGEPFLLIWQDSGTDPESFNAIAIQNALKGTQFLAGDESLVTVTGAGLYTYNVTITGPNSGKAITIEAQGDVEDGEVAQDALSTDKQEPAWSYGNVVSNLENADANTSLSDPGWNFYQCIKPHWSGDTDLTDPDNPIYGADYTEPGVGSNWEEYWVNLGPTAPSWFRWQHQGGANDPTPDTALNPWNNRLNTTGQTPQVYAPWDRGFPEVASFYQQRLIFFTIKDAVSAFWGSRVGDYKDFTLGTNDSDPFAFDLATSDSPKITWAMATQSALIIGTSSGDFRLGFELGLAPGDIQVTKENNARSYKTKAVSNRQIAYYIERGRQKLRGTVYGRQRNAWQSDEVSLAAEHLFQGRISRLALVQTPEAHIFALKDDGGLVVMSMIPEGGQNVAAFSEVALGNTKIVDLTSFYTGPNSDLPEEDILLATVEHADGTFHVEQLRYPRRGFAQRTEAPDNIPPDTNTLTSDGSVYLDSYATGSVDDTQITGLHLRGTVGVIVDDAWYGEWEVNDSGTITFPETVSGTYAVGYLYEGRAETFEKDDGNPRGTGFGTKRRWNQVYVRLLNSCLPRLNNELPSDRRPKVPHKIPDLIRDGIVDAKVTAIGNGDGSIVIIQDRPYPTQVLGYFGEFSVGTA